MKSKHYILLAIFAICKWAQAAEPLSVSAAGTHQPRSLVVLENRTDKNQRFELINNSSSLGSGTQDIGTDTYSKEVIRQPRTVRRIVREIKPGGRLTIVDMDNNEALRIFKDNQYEPIMVPLDTLSGNKCTISVILEPRSGLLSGLFKMAGHQPTDMVVLPPVCRAFKEPDKQGAGVVEELTDFQLWEEREKKITVADLARASQFLASATKPDPYQVLGVPEGIPQDELLEAFLALMKKWTPTKANTDEEKRIMVRFFDLINAAKTEIDRSPRAS
jgi:hypothetical protein